jgi:hypothetical protein
MDIRNRCLAGDQSAHRKRNHIHFGELLWADLQTIRSLSEEFGARSRETGFIEEVDANDRSPKAGGNAAHNCAGRNGRIANPGKNEKGPLERHRIRSHALKISFGFRL